MAVVPGDIELIAAPPKKRGKVATYVRRHPTITVGGGLLGLMLALALFAPFLGTSDPTALSPAHRLRWPSAEYWFGTDTMGRDIYSRTIYGARVSLAVGISVALFATGLGLFIGLVTGLHRWADAIVMRIMDGVMSIPGVLIAIALMALTRASMGNVIFAITVAEVPRVTRLVRSVVLTLREQPFVEGGDRQRHDANPHDLARHIVPNTLATLLVQGHLHRPPRR